MKTLRNCGIRTCLVVVLVFSMFNCGKEEGQDSEYGSLNVRVYGLERVQEDERIELILSQDEEIRRREFCEVNGEGPFECGVASIAPGTYCLIAKLLADSDAILGESCQQECGITISAGETTDVSIEICVDISENPDAGNLDVGITIRHPVVEVDSGVILRVSSADVQAGGATIELPVMLYPDSQALPTAGDFTIDPIADGLTLTRVTAGRSAIEAEKQVEFNPNTNIVVIAGFNRNPIRGGELVILTIAVSPGASGSSMVCLPEELATMVNAVPEELAVETQCGTITIY